MKATRNAAIAFMLGLADESSPVSLLDGTVARDILHLALENPRWVVADGEGRIYELRAGDHKLLDLDPCPLSDIRGIKSALAWIGDCVYYELKFDMGVVAHCRRCRRWERVIGEKGEYAFTWWYFHRPGGVPTLSQLLRNESSAYHVYNNIELNPNGCGLSHFAGYVCSPDTATVNPISELDVWSTSRMVGNRGRLRMEGVTSYYRTHTRKFVRLVFDEGANVVELSYPSFAYRYDFTITGRESE